MVGSSDRIIKAKYNCNERKREKINYLLHDGDIRTAHIRCQWRKTTILSCHRCLINTGVEKMNNI